jgi:uncharacterized protein YbjT (DUF2867 family)
VRRESMRIAVMGGTGVLGRHTVEALRRSGHDTVVIARSRGVDISSGQGLEDALVGVDAVIDVTNLQAPDAEATRNLFAAATRNLLAAEQRARVQHHVLLSIVGIDRLEATRTSLANAGRRSFSPTVRFRLQSNAPLNSTSSPGWWLRGRARVR